VAAGASLSGAVPFLSAAADGRVIDSAPTFLDPREGAQGENGSNDWSVRNEAYWTRIDRLLQAMRDRGMVAVMFPAYLETTELLAARHPFR
jgi:hypothetical protein